MSSDDINVSLNSSEAINVSVISSDSVNVSIVTTEPISVSVVPSDDISVLVGTSQPITVNVEGGVNTVYEWGKIIGTLSNQTDLQTALNLKADESLVTSLNTTVNSHIADASIHYAMTDISITTSQISDLTNLVTEPELALHTTDSSIHYTTGAISITESQISDLDKYTTSEVDAILTSYSTSDSIASTYVPYTGATTDVDLGENYLMADKIGVNAPSAPIYPFQAYLKPTDYYGFFMANLPLEPVTDINSPYYNFFLQRYRTGADFTFPFTMVSTDKSIQNFMIYSGVSSYSGTGDLGIWGLSGSAMENNVDSTFNPSAPTQFGGSEALTGLTNTITKSGTFQPTDAFAIGSNLNLSGIYNTINNAVTVTDSKVAITEYGLYNTIGGSTTVGASPALTRRTYGIWNIVNSAANNPTAVGVTIERTGGYFSTNQQGGTNKGIETRTENQAATNYGVYAYSSNGNTNWAFYNARGNNFLGNDNAITYVGTGVDAGYYYDSVDFVVNPRYVGTGVTKLLYAAKVAGATLGNEKLTNGTFTGNANSWTLGTGFRYNTNLVRKDIAGTGTLSQAIASMVTPLVLGEWMTLTFVISSRTAGGVTPSCGGFTGTLRSANGTYKETFRVTNPALPLTFTPDATTARFYIDTISLKAATDGNLDVDGILNVYKTSTFTGTATFFDKAIFTQTDGNEFIDSLNDGYMDYGATTQHRFNNDVVVDGDISADNLSDYFLLDQTTPQTVSGGVPRFESGLYVGPDASYPTATMVVKSTGTTQSAFYAEAEATNAGAIPFVMVANADSTGDLVARIAHNAIGTFLDIGAEPGTMVLDSGDGTTNLSLLPYGSNVLVGTTTDNGSGAILQVNGIISGNGSLLTDIRTNMLYDTNAGSTSIFAQNYELFGSASIWVSIIDAGFSTWSGNYSYSSQLNTFPTFGDGLGHYIYFDNVENKWVISEEENVLIADLVGSYLKSSAIAGISQDWKDGTDTDIDMTTYTPTYIGYQGDFELGVGVESNHFIFFNKGYDETLERYFEISAGFATEVGGMLVDFGTNFSQLNMTLDERYAGGLFRIDTREGFETEFFNLKYIPTNGTSHESEQTVFGVTATGEVWGASAGLFGYGIAETEGGTGGVGSWDATSMLQVNGVTKLGTPDTNHTQFDDTGHQTMIGTAKPWDDLRIEPTARGTGANNPTFEKYFDNGSSSRGVYLYSFDDAVGGSEKEVFFTMQMPHSWDGGSIDMHVHWIGDVADTTAAPRWGLEYNWKEIGAVFGNTTIVYTDGKNYTDSGEDADVTAKKHYVSKFTALVPGTTADGLSSILIGRLFRDSADAGDTYNATGAKCGLLYIDAHFQINSIGSTDEYSK